MTSHVSPLSPHPPLLPRLPPFEKLNRHRRWCALQQVEELVGEELVVEGVVVGGVVVAQRGPQIVVVEGVFVVVVVVVVASKSRFHPLGGSPRCCWCWCWCWWECRVVVPIPQSFGFEEGRIVVVVVVVGCLVLVEPPTDLVGLVLPIVEEER